MDERVERIDIAVVGGGPNGLFCALRMRESFPGKRIVVFEKEALVQNLAEYPNVRWHSMMSELKLPSYLNDHLDDAYHPTSSELVAYYRHFAQQHGIDVRERHEVVDVISAGARHHLSVVADGDERGYDAKSVILCTGIFQSPRRLEVPHEFPFCSHRMDIATEGKTLVLIGSGNSATDFIIYLLPRNKIHWVMRSRSWTPAFHNLATQFDAVMEKYRQNLTLHQNVTVTAITADKRITLSDGTLLTDFDACTIFVGYNSRSPLFERMGLAFDHECLALSPHHETSREGVFAFGSVMAHWNGTAPQPTFIHNGNPVALQRLIDQLALREAAELMPSAARIEGRLALGPVKRSFRQRAIGKIRATLGLRP